MFGCLENALEGSNPVVHIECIGASQLMLKVTTGCNKSIRREFDECGTTCNHVWHCGDKYIIGTLYGIDLFF